MLKNQGSVTGRQRGKMEGTEVSGGKKGREREGGGQCVSERAKRAQEHALYRQATTRIIVGVC
jgi:hypothetical protein